MSEGRALRATRVHGEEIPPVILHLSYEELRALESGARTYLEGEAAAASVLAPPESRGRVEALVARLDGDLSLSTLNELRGVHLAVSAIVDCLREEMEANVLMTHAADEGAVAAYFDFAHAFTAAHRITEMVAEMEALVELVTGAPPNEESSREFRFPD